MSESTSPDEAREGAVPANRAPSPLETAGELPAVRAEVPGVVKPGVLFADDDPANAAHTGNEVARSFLKRPFRRKEVGHEDRSAGSLFHDPKATGLEI